MNLNILMYSMLGLRKDSVGSQLIQMVDFFFTFHINAHAEYFDVGNIQIFHEHFFCLVIGKSESSL